MLYVLDLGIIRPCENVRTKRTYMQPKIMFDWNNILNVGEINFQWWRNDFFAITWYCIIAGYQPSSFT